MLILFDIDGTILLTQRAGTAAMQAAAQELFGHHFTFDGIEMGGWLDPIIWHAVATANGIEDPASHHDRFRAAYKQHFEDRLANNPTVQVLPGIVDLLSALIVEEDVTLGLVTGNYPETGLLKLQAAGIDPSIFKVAAWGTDGSHRRELPLVAMAQYEAHCGQAIAPSDVVIIGDTLHDIDCAKANGCRSIAVSTGFCPADKLAAKKPDLLVIDLSDTQLLVKWMLKLERKASI